MTRSVYLSSPVFMPNNTAFSDYVKRFEPSSIVYKSGILKNADDLSFLDLNGSVTDALNWLIDQLSSNSLPILDKVVVTSSTVSFSPQQAIEFWTELTAALTLSNSSELYFLGGRGCNSMVFGCLQSIKEIESGSADNALVINLDLFLESGNRYSDYAFFSDAVGFIIVSSNESDYLCAGYDTSVASYNADAFSTSCCFSENSLAQSFYQQTNPELFTLNTFYFLLSKKYQAKPNFLRWELANSLSVHRYSLDPFFNLAKSNSKNSVLHVESPPFHCDELRLTRY